MKVNLKKVRDFCRDLNAYLDRMESSGAVELETQCNTYDLYEFISFGSDGYLTIGSKGYDRDENEIMDPNEEVDHV